MDEVRWGSAVEVETFSDVVVDEVSSVEAFALVWTSEDVESGVD